MDSNSEGSAFVCEQEAEPAVDLDGTRGIRRRAPRREPLRRLLLAESGAFAVVAVIAAAIAIHLALSPRSWLLYYDGDSVLPALVHASIQAGQPQSWVLSAPLFAPEMASYLVLAALGFSTKMTLSLAGIVNWLAFYVVLRYLIGGSRRVDRFSAVAAMSAAGALALLESSPNRNQLEDASLLSTSTYYSATAIAVLLTLGIVLRLLDRPRGLSWRRLTALGAVTAVSVWTNEIFILWGILPIFILLVVLTCIRRLSWRRAAGGVGALLLGGGAGVTARIPFASMLVENTKAMFAPQRAAGSLRYYEALTRTLWNSSSGRVELTLLAALILWGAVASLRTWHGPVRLLAISIASWLFPLIAALLFIGCGTVAARYLQPVFLMPPVAACVIGQAWPTRVLRLGRPAVALSALAFSSVIAVSIGSQLTGPKPSPERSYSKDVRCVDRWVAASHEIGAGQYWTVRAPKAYLRSPGQLVQTDANLDPYIWLVNKADYLHVTHVSFLVESADSAPFGPLNTSEPITPPQRIGCGRYEILNYRRPVLELGSPHD